MLSGVGGRSGAVEGVAGVMQYVVGEFAEGPESEIVAVVDAVAGDPVRAW